MVISLDLTELNQQLSEFGLEALFLPVEELKPYDNNPNNHTEESYSSIAQSIEAYGFKSVILVDNDNEIIYGHGRLVGAIRNGLKFVPVLRALNLSKLQAQAFRIADNYTAKKSDFNLVRLVSELDSLVSEGFDIQHTGFNLIDLESARLKLDDLLSDSQDTDSPSTQGSYSPEDPITYNLTFRTEADQEDWFTFLAYIAGRYPEQPNISSRICTFIEETDLNTECLCRDLSEDI